MNIFAKKLTVGLLILTMLASCFVFAGCNKQQTEENTEENTLGEVLENIETQEDFSKLTLPEGLNYGGEEFTVLTYNSMVDEFGNSTSKDPDMVEEALYNRDSYVADVLDIRFVYNKMKGQFHDRESFYATVSQAVLMQNKAWDLIGT